MISTVLKPEQSAIARYYAIALSPWMVLACVGAGAAFAQIAPDISRNFDFIGKIYVDLLKMIVLPFMMATIVFSLQQMFRDGHAMAIIPRVLWVFLCASTIAVGVAAVVTIAFHPGSGLSEETRSALGQIVGGDLDLSNTRMSLHSAGPEVKAPHIYDLLNTLVPSNIFAALSSGETIKALIFALLFGAAVGQIRGGLASSLSQTLETIYKSCQILTRWINLPLPFVLFSISASQVAAVGMGPIRTMALFVGVVLITTAALLALSLIVVQGRAGCGFGHAIRSMQETFALGVATNNATSCMPAIMDGLIDKLGFDKVRVELLAPLVVSLLRTGAMAYFVCATLFVAQFYGREVSVAELAAVLIVSQLAGYASMGMAGVVTLTLVGTTTGLLGLPFEAAYFLFAAIDPICAMARTALTVVGGAAAVAVICERPAKKPALAPSAQTAAAV
ncbi:MAG: cation:dicarboxylase symporter family transporter [Rhodoblastus sp.]|nr:cation:dicarboxylase symporter family transporter [Rhodoblastus sp.]